MEALSEMTSVCTSNDLKSVVRLIKGDLRIQVSFKITKYLAHHDLNHINLRTRRRMHICKQEVQIG
jgi:hypothetical protein